MKITLPFPSSELHAHAKGHWRAKADATSAARELAFIEGREALWRLARRTGKCTIAYKFFVPNELVRDAANMVQGCKPYVDGLVSAGVIYRDDWKWLDIVGVRVEVDRERPRVELEIEEVTK